MRKTAVSAAEDTSPPNVARLAAEVQRLAPWFHNLHLPGGVQTAPDHWLGDFPSFKWRQLEPFLPARLDGWQVLDIGCNAGYYSLALAARGATVLGVDVDAHYLRQAEWAAGVFGLAERIRFEQRQVYELPQLKRKFDLVLFMGVFYHLRYPLLALDIVRRCTRNALIFQTLTLDEPAPPAADRDHTLEQRVALSAPGWPRMAFIEHRLQHDPTNWWVPNSPAVEAMLRSSGFRIVATPGHELWLCEPGESSSEAPQIDRATYAAVLRCPLSDAADPPEAAGR